MWLRSIVQCPGPVYVQRPSLRLRTRTSQDRGIVALRLTACLLAGPRPPRHRSPGVVTVPVAAYAGRRARALALSEHVAAVGTALRLRALAPPTGPPRTGHAKLPGRRHRDLRASSAASPANLKISQGESEGWWGRPPWRPRAPSRWSGPAQPATRRQPEEPGPRAATATASGRQSRPGGPSPPATVARARCWQPQARVWQRPPTPTLVLASGLTSPRASIQV